MHEVGECLRRLRDARDDARSQLALAQGHVDALARSLHATCVARDESRDRADALEEVRVSLVANVQDYRERCEAIARERDEARAEVERLRAAAARSMSLCSWECSDETYCGRCAPLVRTLDEVQP